MARVRLSGGLFRGRTLEVGAGVRPTEGRVREALFSIWQTKLPGARLLDLFAGSGAVGIEAVGRGARQSVLVEENPGTVRLLAKSLESLEADVTLRRLSLPMGLASSANWGQFDLVFADPPYDFDDYVGLLDALPPLLTEDAEVVIEHRSRQRITTEEAVGWSELDQRVYGECALSFLRFDPGT